MSRDEALEELKKPPLDKNLLEQDKFYVLKKLGLTESEFEQILNEPNKKFSDYPNNDSIWRNFGFLIKIARNIITRVN
jgi:hypothetical protein